MLWNMLASVCARVILFMNAIYENAFDRFPQSEQNSDSYTDSYGTRFGYGCWCVMVAFQTRILVSQWSGWPADWAVSFSMDYWLYTECRCIIPCTAARSKSNLLRIVFCPVESEEYGNMHFTYLNITSRVQTYNMWQNSVSVRVPIQKAKYEIAEKSRNMRSSHV